MQRLIHQGWLRVDANRETLYCRTITFIVYVIRVLMHSNISPQIENGVLNHLSFFACWERHSQSVVAPPASIILAVASLPRALYPCGVSITECYNDYQDMCIFTRLLIASLMPSTCLFLSFLLDIQSLHGCRFGIRGIDSIHSPVSRIQQGTLDTFNKFKMYQGSLFFLKRH